MAARGDFGQDKVLERHMEIFRNDPEGQSWIADRVLPPMMVGAKTGSFYRVAQGGFSYAAEINDLQRASGAPFKRMSFDIAQIAAYILQEFGIEAAVDDFDQELGREDGLDLRETAAELAGERVQIFKERIAQALLFTPGNWGAHTAAVAAGDRWNVATGDPRLTIDANASVIRRATGTIKRQLSLVVGHDVWEWLSKSPFLTALYQNTNAIVALNSRLTEQMVASALQIKEVIVGTAVANTAAEGAAVANADIWGQASALLGHIVPSPRPKMPHGIGGTFRHRSTPAGGTVVRYRENNPPAEFVRNSYREQAALTNTLEGFLSTTVI